VDFHAQPALHEVAALAFEPVARLGEVLGEAIEFLRFHFPGLGDIDHVITCGGDVGDVSGLAAKGQSDAQLFNLHLLAIKRDGQRFAIDCDGHCFHGLAPGQATR
jgi:hypothetical protein